MECTLKALKALQHPFAKQLVTNFTFNLSPNVSLNANNCMHSDTWIPIY